MTAPSIPPVHAPYPKSPTHTFSRERFSQEMERRGWRYDPNYSWISPSGKSRQDMEKDYVAAILIAVNCPHEEAGADDSSH